MGKLGFAELRIIAQAAYDITLDASAASERSEKVGQLFYPQNLPSDQRRLGGMLVVTIKNLDESFRRKELFGGPALAEDTRRLLVADVVASAHLQARDLGWLQKIIDGWYPAEDAPAKAEAGERAPESTMFSFERVLGGHMAHELREAYSTLYSVTHGVIWLNETDNGADYPGGINPLQTALYAFSKVMDPLFKGEVAMKGEG